MGLQQTNEVYERKGGGGLHRRRPVGRPRPRKTWLESVEVDIAELEIDKEDVHDRRKWRRNVMKRKSNPIGKQTINR